MALATLSVGVIVADEEQDSVSQGNRDKYPVYHEDPPWNERDRYDGDLTGDIAADRLLSLQDSHYILALSDYLISKGDGYESRENLSAKGLLC